MIICRMERFLYILYCLLVLLSLVSCSDRGKEMTAWRDDYISDSLTRKELLQMAPEEREKIIRSLSPEQKAWLWDAKMEDVLENWPLSRREKKVLKRLRRKISASLYANPEQFAREISHVENDLLELGWSEERLYLTLETFETLSELRDQFPSENSVFVTNCERDEYLNQLLK